MIYNTNQSNNRAIQLNERTNVMNGRRSLNNNQRRVTFADQLNQKHIGQVIQPTNKQMYNFTYGQQNNHKNMLTQSVYRTFSPHLQTFQHIQPRQSLPSNSFISHQTNSRINSTGKRRLKIFPQKFDQSKQKIIVQIPVVQQKQNQVNYQQVIQLKSQIQNLKLQIRNLSQNMSRTSGDFTSQSQIHKHQIQRTRRLSQLNQFNEKLYSQLALKLKQISQKEYQNYIEQSQSNKKLLDEIFQSGYKTKSYQDQWEKQKQGVNQNFMDIRQFQQQYQQKYNSTGVSDYMYQQFDFVPQNPPPRNDDMIISPLLLYQNQVNNRNAQKDQAFTFHKQGIAHHQRHFRKCKSRVDNYQLFTLDGNRNNTPQNRVHKSPSFEIISPNKTKFTQNLASNKAQRQIEDFNRQLQTKILRKRFNSQYTTINKKKIYS